MTEMPKTIPTNIITGVLGAGKTTAIQSLIDQKPDGQRWAVVINEYGQVAIDDALLQTNPEIQVMELASGCVCCTMSYAFQPLLAQLIRQVKPHRLIIEPSGAGHPARLIDMLRDENFGKVLDLRATLCIVDPADFENPRIAESTLFQDQIQMSDSVVINWIDKREAAQVQRCKLWLEQLDPPKQRIYQTIKGKLELDWLELPHDSQMPLRFDATHQPSTTSASVEPTVVDLGSSKKSKKAFRRFENQGNGQWACGWIFAPDLSFERDTLIDYLESLQDIRRVKGIFHCQDDWWAYNCKANQASVVTSSYRADSRLEIISDQPQDWNLIESRLQACICNTQTV